MSEPFHHTDTDENDFDPLALSDHALEAVMDDGKWRHWRRVIRELDDPVFRDRVRSLTIRMRSQATANFWTLKTLDYPPDAPVQAEFTPIDM